ncbi:MAG TPA: enoyl-CoA hydratase-related protein [Blastocatellia bacterium]|jgi:2-(1,2-epoxy-1,2-dihydrophenyl)acetyl-CoA isomerase|nr:enoyl-CoA hydratase-related protein [Blastocatellia bacterium]
MTFDNIIFDKGNSVARITLNRPERLNAFVGAMREEIYEALCRCESDDVRAVVITGAGNGFCSGADVRFLAQVRNTGDGDSLDRVLASARNVVTKIRALPKPVIAAINGPTAGGGINLALACDVRVASERASFGETFIRLGLHPDWGGTFFLPRLAGTAVAIEMMMSGDVISAGDAARLGLVNVVVPHDQLDAATDRMAERFVRNSPRIIAMIKRAVYKSLDATFDEMLDYETAAQKSCFQLEDSAEGLNAFVEKRQPEFK